MIFVQYLRDIRKIFPQYLHNICKIFEQYLQHICTIFVQYLYNVETIFNAMEMGQLINSVFAYLRNIFTIYGNICKMMTQYLH